MNKYLFLTDDEKFVQDIISSYDNLPSSWRIDIISTNEIKNEGLRGRGAYSLIYVDKQIIGELFEYDFNNQGDTLNGFKSILLSLTKFNKKSIMIK